jgi:hypothetical protein
VAPIETISGKKAKFLEPSGLARDASGNIHVANSSNKTVATFASGAHGNGKPTGILKGKKTGLDEPEYIFIR